MSEGLEVKDFAAGVHAQIKGLASKPELNDEYCVSRGVNPDNAERLLVITRSGAQLSLKPCNLAPAELLPGSHVVVVGLTSAAGSKFNGKYGEILSWHGDRWIVDLDTTPKSRPSLKPENIVIVPERITKKRVSEEPPPEAKKLKTSDMRELESNDEVVIAKCLMRMLREFDIVAQKCVCVLATKTTMTVMFELGQHLSDKQKDGLLRRPLQPGQQVKGIEELDAQEQAVQICEKKVRALANCVRINYCDLHGFFKAGFKEPQFEKRRAEAA
ncbi:unnamed protein product [Polarella glacialis]|uniref:Uncharacterized protein n=1 Tax=Polarella glacialis TaxID=89957 RepID=A0A813FH62_POLGL|nr:unnamed protein product [Polarella glacialis]